MSRLRCSVVIPVYNKKATVCRAIDSVLAQSAYIEEVIVVDDGSTDGTAEVLNSYACMPRVRVIHLPENKGVSIARNTGIELACSEWVALLDSDDYWESCFLAVCLRHACPGTHLIGAAYRFSTHSGYVEGRFPLAEGEGKEVGDYYEWSVIGDLPFTCSSVVIRRSKLRELGGFDSNLSMGEDQVVWFKLLCSGKAVFVNKVAATYDLTGSSAVSGLSHRLKNPAYLDVLVKLAAKYGLSRSIYYRKYVRRVCRNTLVYQSAYVQGAALRFFLCDRKVGFLPNYERWGFWLTSFIPLSVRGPLVRSAIKRINTKWG